MRCPRCNWYKVFEEYDKNEEDEWIKKIYCPCCHYEGIFDIPEDESLEDFAERMLQRMHNGVKRDILNCFENNKEYTSSALLDTDDKTIEVTITVKRDIEFEQLKRVKQ